MAMMSLELMKYTRQAHCFFKWTVWSNRTEDARKLPGNRCAQQAWLLLDLWE